MPANTPWHTVLEFEDRIRMTVGTSSDVETDVWCMCRLGAEAVLYSSLPEGARLYRSLLHKVPGELVPQEGPVLASGDITHTLLMPEARLSGGLSPKVWKNLYGPWEDRFDLRLTHLLESGTEYEVTAVTLTLFGAVEGDRFAVEYHHTLKTKPVILKELSLFMTASRVLIARYGRDSQQFDTWSKAHQDMIQMQLQDLKEEKLSIPEFDDLSLYRDWSDVETDFYTFPIVRG